MLSRAEILDMKIFAAKTRVNAMRQMIKCGGGHVGGSMSMCDALGVLYGKVMHIDPDNPRMEDRDRFVLSKGHSGPGLYAALCTKGFFSEEHLDTLNRPGTILPSHCDMNKTPGVDMSSGALGQGLSAAGGMALAAKLRGENYYTYCMIGDGECDEGQIWEASLFAAQQKLDRLIAFIDWNKKQLDGDVKDICDLGDLEQKYRDFNWYTQKVDGHSVEAIYYAIENAKKQHEQPSMIILDTVKGHGYLPCEKSEWPHAGIFVTQEQIDESVVELKKMKDEIAEMEQERSALSC